MNLFKKIFANPCRKCPWDGDVHTFCITCSNYYYSKEYEDNKRETKEWKLQEKKSKHS